MASVNKVIIIGNLGRDPEVRYSADGAAICTISVATSTNWKDKGSGEKREEPEQASKASIICNGNCSQRYKKAQQTNGVFFN